MKCQKQLLSKLDHVQKRALNMCLHITGDVPEDILLTSADVAHLGRRREAHTLNYMYKNKEKEELLDIKIVNTRSRQPNSSKQLYQAVRNTKTVLYTMVLFYQVGAKMGKLTRPVYWGRTVITGHTVGDMLDWAPRMCSA